MGSDNQPKERQTRKLERKTASRASYDRILIVTEGKKTEPNYFNEIIARYRLHTANIEVRHCQYGTSPLQVVEYANDVFEKGDLHKKIKRKAFEQVYAVFDRDDHETYFKALTLAKSLNGNFKNDENRPVDFHAVPSVPCFELWLLLHFEEISAPIHRDEVFKRLKKHIPNYEKGGEGYFAATRDKLDIAIERARRLMENNGTEPYTDVQKLVSLLIKLRFNA
jgi:hypothetical protein